MTKIDYVRVEEHLVNCIYKNSEMILVKILRL